MPEESRSPARATVHEPQPAEILGATALNPQDKLLKLKLASGALLGHRPGQFLQVSVHGAGEEPMTICSAPVPDGSFELVVSGDNLLAQALRRQGPGNHIGVRGPFGNGFDLEVFRDGDALIVADESGLVSLRGLIQALRGEAEACRSLTVLCAAPTPGSLLFADDLAAWREAADVDLRVSIHRPDPGWDGHVGVITTLLRDLEVDGDAVVAAVAGPPLMYRFVMLGLDAKGVPAERIFLSLGHHLLCGSGTCGHCRIHDTYVCKDGPVFSYSDLRGKPGSF